ncbi:type II secretion system protein [Haloferula chungangensis]|uniref:Type II secretion system protein n=1 Tax=Haloferula chungangensis TaxID=1048331 RepID=A0ABW2L652_9BACT
MKYQNSNELKGAARRKSQGFTLTELMVVILIIVVLAALSFSGYKRMKSNASAMVDMNDMRTVYSAINMYTADNNGFLPTAFSGVGPEYYKGKKGLVNSIHPYLGVDEPEDGHYFKELASENFKKSTADGGPSMLIMQQVYSGRGEIENPSRPEPSILPFGYPTNHRAPMRWSAAISKMGNPSMRLMMTENDSLHPNYNGSTPGWFDGLADEMAHGSYRLGLYWDGRVGKLDINLNPR